MLRLRMTGLKYWKTGSAPWIVLIGVLIFHFQGVSCSYLKTNPNILVSDVYRDARRATPHEIEQVVIPPYVECYSPKYELLYVYHQKRQIKKFTFWSPLTDENLFTSLDFGGRAGNPYNREVVANDETFAAMSLAPLILLLISFIVAFLMTISTYSTGAFYFWMCCYIKKHISLQPVRQYIRDKVIKRELLERRKQAYLRQVMEPNIRKPPKSKFRLYWLWRDYTFEEIPDILAEQEDDPLYPYIRGLDSSSSSEQDIFEFGFKDEDSSDKEVPPKEETPEEEKERHRLVAKKLDEKIAKLALARLPASNKHQLPKEEEQPIVYSSRKLINERRQARARRLTQTLSDQEKDPKRRSVVQLLSPKATDNTPIKKSKLDGDIRKLKLEELIEEMPDMPFSLDPKERLVEAKALQRILFEIRRKKNQQGRSPESLKPDKKNLAQPSKKPAKQKRKGVTFRQTVKPGELFDEKYIKNKN